MTESEIVKKKGQAEGVFRKKWPQQAKDHVSDFGAYCVEQWLTGRHPETSYVYLGIDYLRSFAHRTRACGDPSIDRSPGRLRFGPEADVDFGLGRDSVELGRFIESSALRDRRLPRRDRVILILYFQWEFTLGEIGDLFSMSEPRISQLLTKAMSDQKKRIQASAASENERERQRKQQEAISREVQDRSSIDEKTQRMLAKIRSDAAQSMEQRQVQEVPQIIQGTFRVNAF